MIELLVVIAIIGLLAGAVSVAFSEARKKTRDTRRISDLKAIESALQLYYDDKGYFPKESGGANGTIGAGGLDPELTPYLSKIPADPTNKDDYRYYYDGQHNCGGGLYGTIAALYAVTMEAGTNDTYKLCPSGWGGEGRGSTNDNGTQAYNIILGPSDG